MDSVRRLQHSSDMNSETLLRRTITLIALVFVVYLPLETGLIGGLPFAAYWVLRLLPDAMIAAAAAAVVLVGDPGARSTPVRLLWMIGVVTALVVVVNTARGFPVADSVNALRVLVRYLVLGVLLWWAVDGRGHVDLLVIRGVLIAGMLQIAVASVQIVSRIVGPHGTDLNSTGLFFLDGTLGRYDRFGLLLMGTIIAFVATTTRIRSWRLLPIAACVVLLFLSTSRQAMVGLSIACLLIAILPTLTQRHRVFAGTMAAVGLTMILVSPAGMVAPTPSSEPGSATSTPTPSSEPGSATSTPTPSSEPGQAGSASAGPSASGGDLPADAKPSRQIKDTLTLSTDPNRNFRLFYNLELAPWAAVAEPLIGFGPRQQVAERPDPRLEARVEAAGMAWQRARRFTNDSNYASLIVQFGAVVPVLFLVLLAWVIVAAARSGLRKGRPGARFAVAFAAATLVAAFFGPAFEIRTVSIVLWISLFGVLASTGDSAGDGGVPARTSHPPADT